MARQTQGPDVGSQPIRDESKRDFMKVAAAAGAMAVLGRNSLAWASDKDTIRIGYISPKTGPFSPFAEADDFILGQVRKSLSDGLTIGGKKYAVEIFARDDQSNPDRQSNLAAELINKDNIDLMLAQVAIGPNASQQCELNGVPCISTVGPWQAWLFPLKGDPAKGFKNVFHFFWGLEDIVAVYEDIWKGVPTNKVIGSLFTNDVPGNAMGDAKMGMPAAFAGAGYKIVDIGRFPVGADDFSTFIQAFKKENVEIVTGLFNPPEWASFVKQSAQMGFRPKVATIAKALLFPGAVQALGPSANGMSTEIWWTPLVPLQIEPHRPDRAATRRQLRNGHKARVDAADRSYSRSVRSRHSSPQGKRQSKRPRQGRRCHARDEA